MNKCVFVLRIKRILSAWRTIWLDVKTIPLIHLKIRGKKKEYAQRHLKEICAHCPQSRKLTRDVNGDGSCWWYENWNDENYDIPADFGIVNWVRFYTGSKTKLDDYTKKKE